MFYKSFNKCLSIFGLGGIFLFILIFPAGADLRIGGGYDSNIYETADSPGGAYALGSFLLENEPGSSLNSRLALSAEKYPAVPAADKAWVTVDCSLPLFVSGLSLKGRLEALKQPNDLIYEYNYAAAGFSFGRDVGDNATVLSRYDYRSFNYPNYDTDSANHFFTGGLDLSLNDRLRMIASVGYENIAFSERYLLDASGNLTATLRSDRLFGVEVTGEVDLTEVRAGWSKNLSNGNYYYIGPYGTTESGITSRLIENYFEYSEVSIGARFPRALAFLDLCLLRRDYAGRLARDGKDHLRSQLQSDLQFSAVLEIMSGNEKDLLARLSYLNNQSNDYLSNYQKYWISFSLRLL